MAPPNSFLGKSIRALELRRQYYIEVLGVKESITDEVKMMFRAGFIIKDGGIPVVFGKGKDIRESTQ